MDLNAAIPSELETLPGIGPVLAERIIKFRDALGGFTSLDQLTECYGLTSETLEKIKPRLALVKSPTFISISQLGTTDFSHPYLDKKIARLITAYAKNHGPVSSIPDLRKVYPPDTAWCDKLIPYLKFN